MQKHPNCKFCLLGSKYFLKLREKRLGVKILCNITFLQLSHKVFMSSIHQMKRVSFIMSAQNNLVARFVFFWYTYRQPPKILASALLGGAILTSPINLLCHVASVAGWIAGNKVIQLPYSDGPWKKADSPCLLLHKFLSAPNHFFDIWHSLKIR